MQVVHCFLSAPTKIDFRDDPGCSDFNVYKNQTLSIRVINENPENIKIYKTEINLVDGDSYSAVFKGSSEANVCSDSQTLKMQDITLLQEAVIKLKVKAVKSNPDNAPYVNRTRIELRLKGHNKTGCFTNPLPWPTKDGLVKLNNLNDLGNCFNYNLENAKDDNLEVKYVAANEPQFTVTKIEVVNYKNINLCWTLRSPSTDWKLAVYDDDC